MAQYRLDGSNLKTTYGVKVLESDGNIDFLKRKGKTSENWLDEDGEQAYVLDNDIYFEPRDIILTCQIRGSSNSAMITSLNSLKAVLESPGLHTIYIGTTGLTHTVYFKDGGRITRATKWGADGGMKANFRLILREPEPARQ